MWMSRYASIRTRLLVVGVDIDVEEMRRSQIRNMETLRRDGRDGVYFEGTGGRGRVGGGPGQGGRFCVDISSWLQMMAIEAVLRGCIGVWMDAVSDA